MRFLLRRARAGTTARTLPFRTRLLLRRARAGTRTTAIAMRTRISVRVAPGAVAGRRTTRIASTIHTNATALSMTHQFRVIQVLQSVLHIVVVSKLDVAIVPMNGRIQHLSLLLHVVLQVLRVTLRSQCKPANCSGTGGDAPRGGSQSEGDDHLSYRCRFWRKHPSLSPRAAYTR